MPLDARSRTEEARHPGDRVRRRSRWLRNRSSPSAGEPAGNPRARAGRASQRHAREAGRERSRVTRFGHDQLAAVLVQRSLLRERADAQHDTVEYGSEGEAPKKGAAGLGDPITVGKETRPTTNSVAKWATEMADDPTKLEQARRILDQLVRLRKNIYHNAFGPFPLRR